MNFIVALAVLVVGVGADGVYEGESCSNGRGVCSRISNCEAAIRAIAQRRPPPTCSFQGNEPVVCCFGDLQRPATPSPPRLTPTTTEYVPPVYDYVFNNGGTSGGSVPADGCEPIADNLTSKKTGRKAWDKCIDYQAKYVYPCEKGVALSGEMVRVNHCGHNADELVVGGVDAKMSEFPHMALLGYGSNPESANWLCGGTVVSERFVLTAGHCTSNRDNVEVAYVRTAMLKRSSSLDLKRVYRVSRILKHPQYDPPRKYNDIALLETENNIRLDRFVVPACLPVGPAVDDRASAIGFGLTEYRGSNADNLQKVTLSKFTADECSEKFPPERHMRQGYQDSTQMCYGDKDKSKDTCQGDSGGPLQVHAQHVKCMYTVVGVTSFGRACGFVGEPGIYTRVAAYTAWIESVVWPN